MAALIRHFGDASDANRTCGMCDFCSPERASAQAFREPTRDESVEIKRMLRALAAAASGKSTGKLYTELYPKGELDRKEMDALLDALTRAGYTTDRVRQLRRRRWPRDRLSPRQPDPRRPRSRRRRAARRPADARRRAGQRRTDAQQGKRPQQGEAAGRQHTFERRTEDGRCRTLRAWRAAEAKAIGKPAFVVLRRPHAAADRPGRAIDTRRPAGRLRHRPGKGRALGCGDPRRPARRNAHYRPRLPPREPQPESAGTGRRNRRAQRCRPPFRTCSRAATRRRLPRPPGRWSRHSRSGVCTRRAA